MFLGESDVFFANFKDIRRFKYGVSNYTVVEGGLDDVRSIAYDAYEKLLFYISIEGFENDIVKKRDLKNLAKPAVTIHASTPQSKFAGLAVDWVTKKLYITDNQAYRVVVCDYNGNNMKVLVFDQLDRPYAIALLPQKGYAISFVILLKCHVLFSEYEEGDVI